MTGMATDAFPRMFTGITRWAAERGMPGSEARRRFAQFAILTAVASSPVLQDQVVFKGGNALDFVLLPNRSTYDLDFTLDDPPHDPAVVADLIERNLTTGCRRVATELGMALVVQRVRQQPPGPDRTFVTFAISIGYGLPDQRPLIERARRGVRIAQTIDVEISINEAIGASTRLSLGAGFGEIRISTIEEIVSEKLRALLQQVTRNRQRPQDLLDIAVALRGDTPPDPATVARFLLIKAAAHDVAVSRAAFHDPDLARRTRIGYDDLAATTRVLFIPFDEALADLLAFTDSLAIPETAAG